MSEEEKGKLKVVDFNSAKEERDKIPDNVMDSLEIINKMAKEGKLHEVILYGEWFEDDEDTPTGTMILWNQNYNPKSIIGTLEMLKSISLDALRHFFMRTEEE